MKYRAWVKQITALRLIIGVVLSSLSVFIANPVVKYVYNSCRETIPDVRPKNAAVSSILIPFTVQNRSALFVMRDVRITCKMPMIVWNNGADPSAPIEKGQMYPVAGGDWRLESKQAGVMIKEDSEINYPCDPDELIKDVQVNGQIQKLKRLRVSVDVNYKTKLLFFDLNRHYESPAFTWDLTPDGYRLFEGDFIQ